MRSFCLVIVIFSTIQSGVPFAAAQTASLPSTPTPIFDTVIPVQYSVPVQAPVQSGAPISPPPPTWNPYGPQSGQVFTPSAANPNPTWATSAVGGQPGYPGYATTTTTPIPQIAPDMGTAGNSLTENPTFQQTMRLYQGVRGSWAFIFGNNSGRQLGVNELDTSATFALPFFFNSQANLNRAPLLLTPGFGLQLWNGPDTTANNEFIELPPNTYDTFLDTAWNPQFTPLFGAELGVRVGIFTNWDELTLDSWRVMGRAIGTLNLTPQWQAKVGVIYLDRNQVKLLPAVGATWVPNPNARYDIFFPAPKAAWRFSQWRNRSVWGFVAAEYGGGAWTFRPSGNARNIGVTRFDYNDIRISLGTELVPITPQGLAGSFEVGYVFARNIYIVDQARNLPLNDSLMLRLGLAY